MRDHTTSLSSIPEIDTAAALATTMAVIVLSGATLRSACRVLMVSDDEARTRCRRWTIGATIISILWCALAPSFRVECGVITLLAIAAGDGWLALWTTPRLHLPTARVRRRARRGRQVLRCP